jgi:glutathione S-transferase
MKLHYAAASPFVRMVLVTAHETGLIDRIELVPTGTFLPIEAHEAVVQDNPLGKIPALILDDGMALYDSRVICEYLVVESGTTSLLPPDGSARWQVLTLQALAQGLADTGVNLRYETALRPAEFQWNKWTEANSARISRVFDALAGPSFKLLNAVTVGSISTAVALSYMDFRFPDIGWRAGREALADWHAEFSKRPSMLATEPE